MQKDTLLEVSVTPEYQHAVARAYEHMEKSLVVSPLTKIQVLDYLQAAVAISDDEVPMSERLELADAAILHEDETQVVIARMVGRNILHFGNFDVQGI